MFHNPLINQVVEWERILEIEDEQRHNQRHEPFTNFLGKLQFGSRKRKAAARAEQPRTPVQRGYIHEDCGEAQPC